MNVFLLLQLAISILNGVVKATKGTTDDFIVAGVQAALDELNKVHGQDVTKTQLEALRTEPQW